MDAFHEPRPQSYDPKSGTLPGLGVSTSTIVLAGRGMMKPVLGTSASCLDSVNRSAALPGNGEEVGAEPEEALFLFHQTSGAQDGRALLRVVPPITHEPARPLDADDLRLISTA
jgi:hypothetical protein